LLDWSVRRLGATD